MFLMENLHKLLLSKLFSRANYFPDFHKNENFAKVNCRKNCNEEKFFIVHVQARSAVSENKSQ